MLIVFQEVTYSQVIINDRFHKINLFLVKYYLYLPYWGHFFSSELLEELEDPEHCGLNK